MTSKKQMKTERKLPKRGVAMTNQLMLPDSSSTQMHGEESIEGSAAYRRERRASRMVSGRQGGKEVLFINSLSTFTGTSWY